MINFIFSPVKALFSLKLYRDVSRSPLWYGFLYLGYLAFLFAVLLTVLFSAAVLPKADAFMDWFQRGFPEITLTAQGVVSKVPQPFKMVHPQLGTIMVVDTTTDTPPMAEVRKTFCYITKTQLHVGGRTGSYRVIDLTPQSVKDPSRWKDVTVTGPVALSVYKRVVPLAFPLVFMFSFLFFLLWKIPAGLLYSLIALAVNTFRKPRLGYGKLVNISFFALTPVIFLQGILSFFPDFPVRMNVIWSLLITSLFLAFALLGTQSQEESA